MKKGFTLIELLAVIVILAIIALIATPIVLSIIDNSKKEAVLRSAEFYLDAAEYAIANKVMNSGEIPNKAYQIMRDGNICLGELNNNGVCIGIEGRENNKDDILIVEGKGEKPKEGTIIIENGQIVKELKTELYLEKAELALANTPVGEYAIMRDGNICLGTLTNNVCSGDVVVVEVNIAKPETGTISKTDSSVTISEESKNKTQLVINNHTVIRNDKNELEVLEPDKKEEQESENKFDDRYVISAYQDSENYFIVTCPTCEQQEVDCGSLEYGLLNDISYGDYFNAHFSDSWPIAASTYDPNSWDTSQQYFLSENAYNEEISIYKGYDGYEGYCVLNGFSGPLYYHNGDAWVEDIGVQYGYLPWSGLGVLKSK